MLAEAKREPDRILGEAREQAVREASQTEIVKLAERQAQEISTTPPAGTRDPARDGGLGGRDSLHAQGQPGRVPLGRERGRERLHERSQESVVAGVGPHDARDLSPLEPEDDTSYL